MNKNKVTFHRDGTITYWSKLYRRWEKRTNTLTTSMMFDIDDKYKVKAYYYFLTYINKKT